MIEVKNLSAGYGGEDVIKDFSLSFPVGKVTALLGPNGSGKSTVLKASLGLLPASQGQVTYDGQDLRQMKRKEIAKKAALLAQSHASVSIQALRMVLHGRFPYLSYPRRYGKEDFLIARQAMEETGCLELAERNLNALSGGQRQSVYLAMALAQQTETIFLDEPTTYLDIQKQIQILKMARSLAKSGKAVVVVLHDLIMALQMADQIALLEQGRLLCCDSPEHLYETGLLERVFGVEIHRMQTECGVKYFYQMREEE